MIPLIFRRNVFVANARRRKPCDDVRFHACPYGQTKVTTIKELTFKGEPEKWSEGFLYCKYREYVGPTSVDTSEITREEFAALSAHHLCMYDGDSVPRHEWRCYRCNAVVRSARERHACREIY